jgi:hypothetical protein
MVGLVGRRSCWLVLLVGWLVLLVGLVGWLVGLVGWLDQPIEQVSTVAMSSVLRLE